MGEITGKSRGSLVCFVKTNHHVLIQKFNRERELMMQESERKTAKALKRIRE